MQLDHFFILTEPPGAQASLLAEIGLVEGAPNEHPGQGTANRRFFFSNGFLELLYVQNALEAETGPGSRLRLPQRVADPAASPFGLILRGVADVDPPFAGWRYQPDYFGPERCFLIGENSECLAEPLCIYMPFELPPRPPQPQPGMPFTTVTGLRLHLPVAQPSTVLKAVGLVRGVSVLTGDDHLLEVIFNHQAKNRFRDLRPALPLIIRW